MIRDVLFHTLKGINGWSVCKRKTIDVARVENVTWRKRMFKILDRDHDYTLSVVCYSDQPTMYFKSKTFVQGISHEFIITKRYKTLEEADDECEEIKRKQKMLVNIAHTAEKKLIESIKQNNLTDEELASALNLKK